MKKRFLSVMIIFILILTSCRYSIDIKVHNNDKDEKTQGVDNDKKNNTITAKNLDYELPKPKEFYSANGEYTPLEIEANIPDINIQSSLSNIENLSQFGNLNDVQKEMIEKNGFVVNPTDSQQLFYIYEANTYNRIPSFITTDSVLQLYHIFYDYTLRQTEAEKLYIELKELNKNMVDILNQKYQDTKNQKDKELVGKTLAYFALCEKLLGEGSSLPDEIKTLVEEDYANVKAESKTVSSITGTDVDYSLFKVRGHYSRSDELKAYFGAMSMYGVVSFVLSDSVGKRNEDGAYMSIIATRLWRSCQRKKEWICGKIYIRSQSSLWEVQMI